MAANEFNAGDWVIYRKQKISSSPGPRAQNATPAPKGESYSYIVDKYWVVQEVLDDGTLRLRTKRGKQHVIDRDDPRLRRPRWWQRWLLKRRFRAVEASLTQSS